MYCIECGEKIEEGQETCPKCGKTVKSQSNAESSEAKKDYAAEGKEIFKKMQNGNFWISGMRVLAWVLFVLIILSGLFGCIGTAIYGGILTGLMMLLGSIVFAFIAVACIMIFLDMARDVSEIKNALKKN